MSGFAPAHARVAIVWRWARRVALATLLLSATPAQAAWHRVETDRFIVYGEGSEKAARVGELARADEVDHVLLTS